MATPTRRSGVSPISTLATLATANALTGSVDNTQAFDVTGALRVVVNQRNDGTAGTAGIDVVEISHDAGKSWVADSTTVLPIAQDDVSGTIQASGAINAAGTAAYASFKCGPYEGPTAIRIARGGAGAGGTAWVTGAPSVTCFTIGQKAGALTALA